MRTVKTKNLTILLIAMSVLLLSLGGATYAWLSTAGSSVDPNVSKGSIVRQYFHTGTGTPEDPFVITRPIHYYHMVELYQRIDGFADKDYCFQLGYDLDGDQDGSVGSGESWKVYAYDDFGNVITDASGRPTYSDALNMKYYSNDLAVLPVGTSDVPFNGTFNGNSLTVDNLYVKSSEFVDMNNNGVVDEGETFGTCDLGIFGFVGEDAVIRNVYYKNVEISLQDADVLIPCKGNAELHDKNGDSEQDIVYVGMLAGHVMTSATFDDVYINDCTIYGGASANSGYGYFGCVENANTHQQANSLGSTVATIRGAGTDAGFGGSVDITSLFGRIQNVLGQNSYGGVNRVANYPTRETVTATTGGEIPPVTVQATANIGQNSNGNTVYRWTSEGAGNYIGTVSGSYTYLYGLKPAQTTVVTTNSKTGAIVDAWLVAQNGNYVLVNGANVTSTTMNQRASKWIVDENNHWYTIVNGVVYYLNVNNNDEVVASDGLATNATVWQKNEDNELYTVMNGVAYYLYEDGGWKVAPKEETVHITDGANHFLNATTTAVSSGNTEETATGWVVTETDDGTIFYILRNGRPYYLTANNGALTMSETEFVWSKDGDSYYTGNGEIRYYLTYDNGWKVKVLTGTKIHVGTNYLNATTTGTGNTTEANAPLWYFETVSDTETRIYTFINGRNYYLTYNGALTVTTTATTWTKDGDAYSIRYANADYYLAYENGWTAKNLTGYVITDGDGNYMRATGQNQFTNTTSLNEATLFTFSNTTGDPRGTISYRIGAQTYYLGVNNGAFANTQTSWTNDGTSLQAGTTGYYLTKDGANWTIIDGQYYLITDGNGNYLNANANYTGITRGTSEATATHWHFTTKGNNPSGTISTEYNGTTYYLRAVQSGTILNRSYSLQLGTTSTASDWTNSNGTLRNSTYRQAYIRYNNNAFSAGTSGTKLSYPSRTESFPASVSFVTKETPTVELKEIQEEPTEISISEPMEITTGLTFRETQDQLYEGTTSTVRRSGYFPIRVAVDGESDYSASSPYKVSQKNTGYIIGGTYSAASSSGQGDIRVSRYGISEISKSYANNRFSTIYTFNGSGTPVAINAQNKANYARFDDVSGKFLDILKQDTSNVYGLHFMDASISMQHLIQAESATILGNTYVNYDLPESSIDFYVVERGFITFMAGDYYTGNNAFFSLHQIFRSGEEQKITAIKEITKVYRHSSLGASRPYIYQYADGTYTNADGTYTGATTLAADYEQAFDCSWITNPTNGSAFDNQYIYYFEIPCNVGEYALGSVDGKTGAYLLYLDIASNGGDIIQSTVSAEGNEVTDCFKVEYRNVPDTVEYSILQFSVDAPETTDFTKFAVTVNFESNVEDEEHGDAFSKGIYTITVNNETGEDVVLYVFLVDDDNNINNNFNFAYRFKYTNETTRTAETVMTTTNLDFWKSVAGFRVPSTGVAEEVSYQ